MDRKRVSPAEAIIMNQDILYGERFPKEKPEVANKSNDFKAIFDKAMKNIEKKGRA